MKPFRWLILVLSLFIASCGSEKSNSVVTIIADGQIVTLTTAELLPANLLGAANLTLGPFDRVLFQGAAVPITQPLPQAKNLTLQVRRAVTLTLITPDGQQTIQTSASTVGQALVEAGFQLFAADHLFPPAETPIRGSLEVTYQSARELTITVGAQAFRIRSAASTIGQALAGAGLPLEGLDYSLPPESDPLPANGQISIVRVSESVILTQKSLPFSAETQFSADLDLDTQSLLQAGEPGLAVSRTRIRYEDGQEVARHAESEIIIRPSRNRILGYGTRIVLHTLDTPNGTVQYWRAIRAFATSYSPCRSAADRCYTGTSSGKPVQKGVIAVIRSWFLAMRGQPVYIPGYGVATIEDVGGGLADRYWVDLGFSDSDYEPWYQWVTVYFLSPVPDNILYILP